MEVVKILASAVLSDVTENQLSCSIVYNAHQNSFPLSLPPQSLHRSLYFLWTWYSRSWQTQFKLTWSSIPMCARHIILEQWGAQPGNPLFHTQRKCPTGNCTLYREEYACDNQDCKNSFTANVQRHFKMCPKSSCTCNKEVEMLREVYYGFWRL